MFVYVLSIEFLIEDSFSLKDKRKTIRSIIERAQSRFKVSAAEIALNDIYNLSHLAFAMVTNNPLIGKKHMDELFRYIETNYPIMVTDYEIIEY